jgi:hypothetical protein
MFFIGDGGPAICFLPISTLLDNFVGAGADNSSVFGSFLISPVEAPRLFFLVLSWPDVGDLYHQYYTSIEYVLSGNERGEEEEGSRTQGRY